MKKKRLISNIIGGLLQLIPAAYWFFTEGQKTIYEAFHFFPHYAVMLLQTGLHWAVSQVCGRMAAREGEGGK